MASPSEQPEAQGHTETTAGSVVPNAQPGQPGSAVPAPPPAAASTYQPTFVSGALFPHEVPSEHWDADFSDSRQVYQGSTLPLWLLAGWAVFIIWALVYLYYGLKQY